MLLWTWLRTMMMGDQQRALAEQIARDCQAMVWSRVGRRAPLMSLAEARGYVRARAALVVHEAVDRELELRGSQGWRHDPVGLLDETTNEVIRLVLKQVLDTRHTPSVVRRAA